MKWEYENVIFRQQLEQFFLSQRFPGTTARRGAACEERARFGSAARADFGSLHAVVTLTRRHVATDSELFTTHVLIPRNRISLLIVTFSSIPQRARALVPFGCQDDPRGPRC